jgi:hypothetical protein
VRNAGRKLADGGQLLALEQPPLELALARHVDQRNEQVRGAGDGIGGQVHVMQTPVPVLE